MNPQTNTTFSERSLNVAYSFILVEANLKHTAKLHTFFQLLKGFLQIVATADPNNFHFEIARKVLSHINESLLKNEHALDLLARELLKAIHTLRAQLQWPSELIHKIQLSQGSPAQFCEQPYLTIHELPDIDETQFFTNSGVTLWDNIYLSLLSSIGPTGKKQAQKMRASPTWNPKFWFTEKNPEANIDFFHSSAFLGLAAILWKDIAEKKVRFAENNVPSLSANVHLPIRKVLCPQTHVSESQMQLINGFDLLASIDATTAPTHIMPAVLQGAKRLNSVYGHRLFRFEVQEPFRKWCAGEPDYRVIKLEGGRTELAEILGFKSNKAITILGEILHAQAHLNFEHQGISGNLIQLTKLPSRITGREEALLITVGTMLLPYHTFEAYKNGECGLLIPLLSDPPLVGANRFHASLYSLQMDIMAELSKHSKELYTNGCIPIPKVRWTELCIKNEIPLSLAHQVHSRWTRDDIDGPQFLQPTSPEHYTLGSAYTKELTFLKEQGKLRLQATAAGKMSSQSKKKKSAKRDTPPSADRSSHISAQVLPHQGTSPQDKGPRKAQR